MTSRSTKCGYFGLSVLFIYNWSSGSLVPTASC